MENNDGLQLLGDRLNDPAPGVDDNGLDDVNEVPWRYREDIHFHSDKCLVYFVGVITCLCVGLVSYILIFHFERISQPQCNIQFDLLMIVGLATIAALCLILIVIHLVKVNYFVIDAYINFCVASGLALGSYPFGLQTTLWITTKLCDHAMPMVLKVIYWTITVLLCLPSLVILCLLVIFGIYDACNSRENGYQSQLRATRKFSQQLCQAIVKFVADPAKAPKPHMLFKDYTKNSLIYSTLHLQQEKKPEIYLLSLYFSRIFGNLIIDLQAVEDQRKDVGKKADINEPANNDASFDASRGEDNDEIIPKPRTVYFEALACPVCQNTFEKRSLVIESPCCTQSYHQKCLFSKLSFLEECIACGSHIPATLTTLLKRAANKVDKHDSQIFENLNTDL